MNLFLKRKAFGLLMITSFWACSSAVDRISEENLNTAKSPTAKSNEVIQDKDPNSIHFYRIPLEKAFDMAREQNKLLFVDFYADWCQPCKMMDKNVFTVPEVYTLFNSRFINVKLDVEDRAHGSQSAANYNVAAMPTFMVIHPDEGVKLNIRGYRDPQSLLEQVQQVL
jgi:thiol:disulfide interchange protein